MSRRQALNKLTLRALSAASLAVILNNPAKGQDSQGSPDLPPAW